MSDITFGIKMNPEMKAELVELIKSHEVTSKEFIAMLLESYKLEKSREISHFDYTDIDELQRLLKRIQKLYLNLHDKAEVILVEHKNLYQTNISAKTTTIEEKNNLIKNLELQLLAKEEIIAEQNGKIIEINKNIEKLEQRCTKYNDITAETTIQLKKERLLSSKLEEEIINLQKNITQTEHLTIELEQCKLANQGLISKQEEQSSDMWFLRRENEKLKDQLTSLQIQHKTELTNLTQQYELQTKNTILEQKLELIKEEHAIIIEALNKKLDN
ncbi:MAG: hypothetical protein ATN33_08495 [Epulopiscium sp. Nele67-Bin001]|nr:MAG: hypothetical protein ATN33_08495 [Epulopiscium sp. Nele67-Bin001]